MQSGYAELLGLYPVKVFNKNSEIPSVATPPFRLRDKDLLPLSTYFDVPVMNFEDGNYSDFKHDGCPAVAARYEERR